MFPAFKTGTPIVIRCEIECAALSDAGNHSLNADAKLVLRLGLCAAPSPGTTSNRFGDYRQLVAVCDGVGRAEAGLRASRLTMEMVTIFAEHHLAESLATQNDLFAELVPLCQKRLREEAERCPEVAPMGTTLTLALIDWPEMQLLHVGDSRCYVLRPGRLECLTKDHTIAERMVEVGVLSREQVAQSQWSHVLWNAVNSSNHNTLPDRRRVRLAWGDTVLLCTDGLTRHVSNTEIATILRDQRSVADKCRRLVDVANERGGADNVTVVVARGVPHVCEKDYRQVQQSSTETLSGHHLADAQDWSTSQARPNSK